MMHEFIRRVPWVRPSKDASGADGAQEEHRVHDVVEGVETDDVLLSRAHTPSLKASNQFTYDSLGLVVADGPLWLCRIAIDLYDLSFLGSSQERNIQVC